MFLLKYMHTTPDFSVLQPENSFSNSKRNSKGERSSTGVQSSAFDLVKAISLWYKNVTLTSNMGFNAYHRAASTCCRQDSSVASRALTPTKDAEGQFSKDVEISQERWNYRR